MDIIAVGARTPVGLRAESTAAAIRAGLGRIRHHPFLIDDAAEPVRVGIDARLDAALAVWQRIAVLASSAIAEVAAKAPRAVASAERMRVLLSLPEARPGFAEADAARVVEAIAREAKRLPRLFAVETVGRGHAGVLRGLEVASERIARDEKAIYLLCGAESYLDDRTIAWLEKGNQLIKDGSRDGFTPGEAAGAVLVASEARARQIGAPALARVRGVATAVETRPTKGDADCLGEGLAKAVGAAAASLKLPREAIDTVYCDINGERYRTEEWGLAYLRRQHLFKTAGYIFWAASCGDVGAASGALACVLAVQSWQRKYAEGPRALVCAGSESGVRGAAILEESES